MVSVDQLDWVLGYHNGVSLFTQLWYNSHTLVDVVTDLSLFVKVYFYMVFINTNQRR